MKTLLRQYSALTLALVGLLMCAVSGLLTSCAPSTSAQSPVAPPSTSLAGILGGTDSPQEHFSSRYAMLIYDKSNDAYCTGMLIQKNIILTAAHCIKSTAENYSLAFGNKPLAGEYVMRSVEKILIHPNYNKITSANRHDLALLLIKDGAPPGYEALAVPDESFPVEVGTDFTAAGYGRITGQKNIIDNDPQGSGTLRYVDLKVGALSDDGLQYTVDQTSGKGICNGDSGGPAIARKDGRDYAMGIVSAISWTVPSNLTPEQKTEYMTQNDVCRQKSIYINVKKYNPWILEASKQLLN